MDTQTIITCMISSGICAFIGHVAGFRSGYKKGHRSGWISAMMDLKAAFKEIE